MSFEFLWRLVTKGGMQSFLVVVAVDELLDVTVQILQVSVGVPQVRKMAFLSPLLLVPNQQMYPLAGGNERDRLTLVGCTC